MMAGRVQALARLVVTEHAGAADRVWLDAADGPDLARRLGRLPGFGPMKVRTLVTLLGRQFGVRPRGWELLVPSHPTLGDVTSFEELAEYQAAKRAHRGVGNTETPASRNRHKLPSGAQPR